MTTHSKTRNIKLQIPKYFQSYLCLSLNLFGYSSILLATTQERGRNPPTPPFSYINKIVCVYGYVVIVCKILFSILLFTFYYLTTPNKSIFFY